jgi:glycosyltransferase involved in cell wall biosynthesis
MHILLVTPSKKGGMIHYASQLSNSLSAEVDVTQIIGDGGNENKFNQSVKVEEINFPHSRKELFGPNTIQSFFSLREVLDDNDFDIIHLTEPSARLLPVLPTLSGRELCVTIHDVNEHEGEKTLHYELVQRLLVKMADNIFVHGKYNLNQLNKKYGKNIKCKSIPHGDYSMFRNYCDTGLTYDPMVLFFGRLEEYKGLETLIDAADIVSEFDSHHEIIIAGNGELAFDKQLLPNNIKIINRYIPDERVCELFSRACAVVLPYHEATQSGIIPISYSFSKPVIVSSVGGIPEVVEHQRTGFLVEPEDSEELANYILKVIRNKQLCIQMGKNAKDFSELYLNWKNISKEIISSYKSYHNELN